MNPPDFIRMLAPAAQESQAKTKIPASFTVAEAALESGWGESLLARTGFNLFGVKADKSWHGETLTMRTREVIRGKAVIVDALWRKYPDWLACLEDHAAFLMNNRRYRKAFSFTHGEDFAYAVAAAGYATDPQYATKLISIIRRHNLANLDGGVA